MYFAESYARYRPACISTMNSRNSLTLRDYRSCFSPFVPQFKLDNRISCDTRTNANYQAGTPRTLTFIRWREGFRYKGMQ